MAKKKEWTVLVWMAGDNDLESFGFSDIQELKKVGSTSAVDVYVQLDTMRDDHTRRYHVQKGTTLDDDVVMDLGETDTGDPKVAIDFFRWGIARSPSQRVLLVIWNHGSGIDETDVYRGMARSGTTVARRPSAGNGAVPRRVVAAALARRYRRALFSTTVRRALRPPRPGARAIAYDDSARDFLDNMELAKVLAAVKAKLRRKVDLLGFDACLMNMIEVGYELRESARLVVGSEEVEPGDGWPYDRILADLAARPAMSAEQLGAAIVKRYAESYRRDAVTLSLLDLASAPAAARAVDGLASALIDALRDGELGAITKAVKDTQRYDMKDFVDLGDLAKQLGKRCESRAVREAAKDVSAALADGLVAAERHVGALVARSSGVSIYCPLIVQEAKLVYDRLAFAKATRWDEFLRAYDAA
ncbi:MAG TPA: clostripain-related cysteine peptidase [Candidatus Binatia bacterium]|nr:clostripain-related cysteine peptidase [Candidatus Binatia bacterium]